MSDVLTSKEEVVLRGDKKCPHGLTKRAACTICDHEDDLAEKDTEIERLTRELDHYKSELSGQYEFIDRENNRLRAAILRAYNAADVGSPPDYIKAHNLMAVILANALSDEPSSPVETSAVPAREVELLNLIHEAMPYMVAAATGQESPQAEWVRRASKAGGSLLAGYHAMNLKGLSEETSMPRICPKCERNWISGEEECDCDPPVKASGESE